MCAHSSSELTISQLQQVLLISIREMEKRNRKSNAEEELTLLITITGRKQRTDFSQGWWS